MVIPLGGWGVGEVGGLGGWVVGGWGVGGWGVGGLGGWGRLNAVLRLF